jgi:hypothetical protein
MTRHPRSRAPAHQADGLLGADEPLCPDSLGAVEEPGAGALRMVGTEAIRSVLRRYAARIGIETHPADLVEALLAAQDDPLAELRGVSSRRKDQLRELLSSELDYAIMVDRITELLGSFEGRWPELERCSVGHPDPNREAAAFLVLHGIVRREAEAAIRGHTGAWTMLELVPCPLCPPGRERVGSAVDLARVDLPPYKIGCTCRVVPALSRWTQAARAPQQRRGQQPARLAALSSPPGSRPGLPARTTRSRAG